MLTKRDASKFFIATFVVCAWLGGLVFTGSKIVQESTAPGAVGRVPVLWPMTSQLAHRSLMKPTLVLAIHPKCGCSTATVTELGKLLAEFPDRLDVQVLIRQPIESTWAVSSRETTLAALQGVTLIEDHGGAEAERFGALTSGQSILFDTKGREIFAGGLTALRRHEGPNAGRSAVAAFLKSGQSVLGTSPVFGCALAETHPRGDSFIAGVNK